jgi:hypothetical protein
MKASRLPPLLSLTGAYVLLFLFYLAVWSVFEAAGVPAFPWMGILWVATFLSAPVAHRLIVRTRLRTDKAAEADKGFQPARSKAA